MSDVELWAEVPCGHNDTYDLEIGCRGFKWREPTVDDGDIDAAMKVRHHLAWAHDNMGPLAGIGGHVVIKGSEVPRLSDHKETRLIIAAWLGVSDGE